MSTHAEKCPICNGNGVTHQQGEGNFFCDIHCHGCKGIGWVTVEDSEEPIRYHYDTEHMEKNIEAMYTEVPEPQYLSVWTEEEEANN